MGVIVISAAIALVAWLWQHRDQTLRDDFLSQASYIAQAIDINVVQQLSGALEDLDNPRYHRLKQQLIATRRIFPDIRFLYLMGKHEDGNIFIYVDSEPYGSPDESPPGQIYQEFTSASLEKFSTGEPIVGGPETDEWGTWISAFIPLTDPFSGEVVAAFGVDMDARNWEKQKAGAILLPAMLTGLLVLLTWATFWVLRYRSNLSEVSRKHLWTRYTLVICTGLLGVVGTMLMVWFGHYFEQNSRKDTFERLAFARSRLITSTLNELESSSLQGLGRLFAASDFVTRQEFSDYTQSMTANPLISVWSWIPEVRSQDREIIEAAAREDGLSGYFIWEMDDTGKPAAAQERELYYPILYVSPFDPENPALGFDLASEEIHRAALLDALQTGLTTATDPIPFVHGSDDKMGMVIFQSVAANGSSGEQIGLVAATLQADRLVQLVAGKGLTREHSLYIDIVQLYPEQDVFILGSNAPPGMTQHHLDTNLHDHPGIEFSFIQPIFAFGKAYAAVAHPSPAFYQIYPPRMGKIIAFSGGIFTILIMVLVGVFTDRNFILSRLVKQRTKELHESERKFRLALKNSPIVVFQQDKDLRYTWIHNPHPAFDPPEIIGKTDAELLPPEDAAQLTEIKQRVLSSGIGDRQIVGVTMGGQTYYYDLTIDPVRDENGEIAGIACSSVNITERTLAELELRKSELFNRSLIEHLPIRIFVKDRNFIYLNCNQHFADDIGKKTEEIIGKSDFELFPAEFAEEYRKVDELVLNSETIQEIEEKYDRYGKTGWTHSVKVPYRDEHGKIIGVLGIYEEITDRKQAEETIRLHSTALNSSANAVIITDPQGVIEWVNPAFTALTGYSLEESIGRKPGELLKSEVQDVAFYQQMWETILSGQAWRSEIVNRKKDGSLYTEEMSLTPVKTDTGKIAHIVAVKQDISERKQREQEIIKRKNEMQILYEASRQLSQSLQVNDIYHSFYSLVSNLMSCDCLLIASYNSSQKMITARYAVVDGKQIDVKELPAIPLAAEGQGLVSPVIYSMKSKLINDISSEAQPSKTQYYVDDKGNVFDERDTPAEEETVQSIILIPQIFQNDVKGIVQIQCYHKNAYTEEDLKIAEALVSQIAVATNNALLYQQTLEEIETRKQAETRLSLLLRREESIVSLSQALADTLDFQVIYNTVGSYLNEMFDLSYLGISSIDENKKIINIDYLTYKEMQVDVSQVDPVYYFEEPSDCVRANAAITRTIMVASANVSGDACISKYIQQEGQEILTAMIVPMVVEDRLTGLLELYSSNENAFEPVDREWLSMIANLIGLSLQNARLYAQATHRSENLMALHTIDMAISSGVDLRLTINILLEQVLKQLKVDAACVLLHDRHTYGLQYFQGLGFNNAKNLYSHFPISQTLAGTVSLERKNLYIQDLRHTTHQSALAPDLLEEGFVSYYGVPLIAKGQVKGVLEMYHRSILKPDREWLDFVDILAGQSAIALDTAEIFENLQRSNMELTMAYDATIQGWSQALDLRDKETEGHTLRVAEMAVRFARKLGMRESDILNIRRGALLHDIGKIGVPDSILHKPGPLSEEEWIIMRNHPRTAFSLLSNIDYLHDAIDIPYYHHERWDGSGYPKGLRGKEIPLAARLFAIIDVWDALSSDRPYRPAWSQKDALDYIQNNTGTFFDPELVPIFMELVQEYLKE